MLEIYDVIHLAGCWPKSVNRDKREDASASVLTSNFSLQKRFRAVLSFFTLYLANELSKNRQWIIIYVRLSRSSLFYNIAHIKCRQAKLTDNILGCYECMLAASLIGS